MSSAELRLWTRPDGRCCVVLEMRLLPTEDPDGSWTAAMLGIRDQWPEEQDEVNAPGW